MQSTRILTSVVLSVAMTICLAELSEAGPMGTDFTYQGRLMDAGSPGEGVYDFRFRLYDEPDGGTEQGPVVTVEDVGVTEGGFTVNLDFTDDPNVFNGEGRWLEMGVRPGEMSGPGDYTVLAPRQEITVAPYAQFSKFSGGVIPGGGNGGSTTNAWKLTGNSGTTPGTNFLGTTDNKALEFKANNNRVMRMQDSFFGPNIIGGCNSNQVTSGVFGATISGGGNTPSGWPNKVTDHAGTIGGGWGNQAGDDANEVHDRQGATVAGGIGNTASGDRATIAGGSANTASGGRAAIGGGSSNKASGYAATIPGGYQNEAKGAYSFAAGLKAKANHEGCFVWADSQNADFVTTKRDQFIIRAFGGVGIGAPPTGNSLLEVDGRIQMTGFKMDTDDAANGYVLTSDDNGIGTWQAVTGGGGNGIGGSGTANRVPKFTGSTTLGDSQIYEVSGNVGIGVPSPSKKLEVAGGAKFEGALLAQNNTGIGLKDDSGNLGLWVEDGGNVGIGTTTPWDKLEVNGTISSTTGGFRFPDDTVQVTSAGDAHSLDSPDGSHQDVISVDNNGDVKIGSDNPGGRLRVAGSIRSNSGGFVFPDGTTQTSASSSPGPEHAADGADARWVVVLDTDGICPGSWDPHGGEEERFSKVLDLNWSLNRRYNPATCAVSPDKEHNVVTIIKNIDRASPCLAALVAQRRAFNDVYFRFLVESPTGPGLGEYYVIHLHNVKVTHFRQIMRHRGNDEYAHLDEVSFAYEEIEWDWRLPEPLIESDWCFGP